MQIEIKIVTDDYNLALDLIESKRFPERHPIIVPGEAIISKQNMVAADESFWSSDVIELGVDINEDTSVETFANWLYSKLEARATGIQSLVIAGAETQIDEDKILRALQEGIKRQ